MRLYGCKTLKEYIQTLERDLAHLRSMQQDFEGNPTADPNDTRKNYYDRDVYENHSGIIGVHRDQVRKNRGSSDRTESGMEEKQEPKD